MKANYHTHTSFSDGHADPTVYVEVAARLGFTALGFSDHAPLPFDNNFTMLNSQLAQYDTVIDEIVFAENAVMEIWKGLEIDFIPGHIYPGHAMFAFMNLDYVIGAVHYVDFYESGKPWNVDGSFLGFEKGLREIFKGDTRAAVERYYALQKELVEDHTPDILAHMDRIKRHNYKQFFFSTKDDWYRQAVGEVLDAMATSNVVLEVNTKGVYRSGEPEFYPSREIVEMAFERGVGIHPGSDAHYPEHVDGAFGTALDMIVDVGYTDIHHFNGDTWEPEPIPQNVLS